LERSFFATNGFLILLGVGLLALTVVVWRSRVATTLAQLRATTETKARSYAGETEVRYANIYHALDRLASRGAPQEAMEAGVWKEDAAFYIETFVGLQEIAWVDEDLLVRRVVPGQRAAASAGQKANEMARDPADVALWVASSDGEAFTGYIVGLVNVPALMAPVLEEIDDDYALQLSREDATILTSEGWTGADGSSVFRRTVTLEETAVLTMAFAPTAALRRAEMASAGRSLTFGLFLSLLTLVAVYFAQNFNALAMLSERRYRNLFEASQDAILVIDGDGAVSEANPAAKALLGYAPGDLQGMTMEALLAGEDPPGPDDGWRGWVGESAEEVELRCQDGRAVPVDLVISPIGDDEHPHDALVTARDVSKRKRAEAELAAYREHLEELVEERTAELNAQVAEVEVLNRTMANTMRDLQASNRNLEATTERLRAVNQELDDFAYVVSHDLKAPLRGISQLAAWIQEDYETALDEAGRHKLHLLGDRVKRMHALIEGVLQYSRAGRTRGAVQRVDLNALVGDVIELLAPPDHVEVRVAGQLPVVRGDPTRLRQLFQNLVDNAIKAIDKPQGRVRIRCSSAGVETGPPSSEQAVWHVSVSDNGRGIAERHRERIFRLFQTLGSQSGTQSTGVGLALAKRIVETSGGRIWVESTPGEGSTFHVTLPREAEEGEGEPS
jgi:PAS domain S-box-containing protein